MRFGKIVGTMIVGAAVCLNGCAAAIVGAGGTALWQHGKIVSEEPRARDTVVAATKEALKAKKIALKDEVSRDNFMQLRGEDREGKKIAIDVIELKKDSSRIEIRVGMGERVAAKDLLLEVKKQLYEKPGFKLF